MKEYIHNVVETCFNVPTQLCTYPEINVLTETVVYLHYTKMSPVKKSEHKHANF